MKTVTIINEDGSDTCTSRVPLSNAATHIAARDSLAGEAEILLAYIEADLDGKDPIAFKWNDPIEPAKFLFNESEVEEIEAIDPSLITRINVVWR